MSNSGKLINQVEEIREMWLAGATISALCDQFHRARSTIRRVINSIEADVATQPDRAYLICRVCTILRPRSEFNKNKSSRTGYQRACKRCSRELQRKWRQTPAGKESASRVARKRNYGLTDAEYEAMKTAQQGVCAICGKPPDYSFHVDHDHETGEMRGLLCGGCNFGIGYFKDDTSLLERAIAYIKRYQKPGKF